MINATQPLRIGSISHFQTTTQFILGIFGHQSEMIFWKPAVFGELRKDQSSLVAWLLVFHESFSHVDPIYPILQIRDNCSNLKRPWKQVSTTTVTTMTMTVTRWPWWGPMPGSGNCHVSLGYDSRIRGQLVRSCRREFCSRNVPIKTSKNSIPEASERLVENNKRMATWVLLAVLP